MANYKALIYLSFGGPDKTEDVMPFLRNVVRGRNISDDRLKTVAEHYYHFGGKSPINEQNIDIINKLQKALNDKNIDLPIYWGNRNWHPLIEDTLKTLKNNNIDRAILLTSSAYSSYSSCRQYKEDIERAISANDFKQLNYTKIRPYYNHPKFIQANCELIAREIKSFDIDKPLKLILTAHSIPKDMADGCMYQSQLEWVGKTIAQTLDIKNYIIAYQSRSGNPRDPWLEPDILDVLKNKCHQDENIVISPIGFVSDHMEIVYDLDHEAINLAKELKLNVRRAKSASNHALFIDMLVELIEELYNNSTPNYHNDFNLNLTSCDTSCCPKSILAVNCEVSK